MTRLILFSFPSRERLEAEQEKAAVVRQLAAHNHSRDSAIDTDMQEWETDILHLPIVSDCEIVKVFCVVMSIYYDKNSLTLILFLKIFC